MDIARKEAYDVLLKQFAAAYEDDPAIVAQLLSSTVVSEVFDGDAAGGFFGIELSDAPPILLRTTVDALADDSDGHVIEIILHVRNGRLARGEWIKHGPPPVHCWPLAEIRRNALADAQWTAKIAGVLKLSLVGAAVEFIGLPSGLVRIYVVWSGFAEKNREERESMVHNALSRADVDSSKIALIQGLTPDEVPAIRKRLGPTN